MDVATSSLSVTPLHYGVITLDADRTLHYQTESLADPDLQSQAKLCFDQTTRRQMQSALEVLKLSPQETAAMIELAVMMNDEIFDGTLAENKPRIRQDAAWYLWQREGKDLFSVSIWKRCGTKRRRTIMKSRSRCGELKTERYSFRQYPKPDAIRQFNLTGIEREPLLLCGK